MSWQKIEWILVFRGGLGLQIWQGLHKPQKSEKKLHLQLWVRVSWPVQGYYFSPYRQKNRRSERSVNSPNAKHFQFPDKKQAKSYLKFESYLVLTDSVRQQHGGISSCFAWSLKIPYIFILHIYKKQFAYYLLTVGNVRHCVSLSTTEKSLPPEIP